jgi:glycosyltransferase involved in cell wall biosynthesis
MQAARRRSLHFVNWLQDLYPEVAMQLGIPFFNGPIGHGHCRLRDRALRAADANVAVGAHMAENVRLRGIAPQRVHVIPNWCDDEEICPLPAAENPLRRDWGLEDRFVVGYSGNLGRGHDINAVLAAADRLRHHPRMLFLCIGGGHKFDELARCVAERRLDHVFRFIPYLERERLKFSLTVPDVHWISLKPELEGLILPSKLYGIAAAGRPIIAITAKDGEIARLVRQHACGFVIEPDDADALAEVLTQLSADPDRVAAMGARARHMLDLHFTRRQGLERWRGLLESIG